MRAATVGGGCGAAAPATGSGQPAGALPPVPHPSIAAVRTMPAGAAWGCALLHVGPRGAPVGGDGSDGFLKGLAGMVGSLRTAAGAAGQRPCVALAPVVAGRRQRPDRRTPSPPALRGRVQCTLLWVVGTNTGLVGVPVRGGGGMRADSFSGSGLMGPGGQLSPPPPLAPVPPPAATVGGMRLPMCDAFSVISRALIDSRAPPPPAPRELRGRGAGRGGRRCAGGHHALPATSAPPPPSFARARGRGDGARTQLGHGSTGAGRQCATDAR